MSSLIQAINPRNRKFEINFHAFLKHGTIEIRRFSGTTEESQIFGIISMVAAMAKEAKIRTDHILKPSLESKEDAQRFVLSSADQAFFAKQKTQQRTELFILRVNPLEESIFFINSENTPIYDNTVYIYLNQNDNIVYEYSDKEYRIKKGIIESDKRFKNIIQKLKSPQLVQGEEQNILKNQLLYEVAIRVNALISHRVEKQNQNPLMSDLVADMSEKLKTNSRF